MKNKKHNTIANCVYTREITKAVQYMCIETFVFCATFVSASNISQSYVEWRHLCIAQVFKTVGILKYMHKISKFRCTKRRTIDINSWNRTKSSPIRILLKQLIIIEIKGTAGRSLLSVCSWEGMTGYRIIQFVSGS